MNETEDTSLEGREDFRLWFAIRAEDIRLLKAQQWRLAFYLLLFMAFIAGCCVVVVSGAGTVTLAEIWALIIVVFLMASLGLLLMLDYQKLMLRCRLCMRDEILPRLSGDFANTVRDNIGRFEKGYDKLRYQAAPVLVLVMTLYVAAALLTWFLLKQTLPSPVEIMKMGIG